MFRKALRSLLTLNDTPERTALAFAVGVFLGFSPLLGLHTVIGMALAFMFRLNKLAVLIGVYANYPLLLPGFYAFATWFGMQLTGMSGVELPVDASLGTIFSWEFLRWLGSQWRLLIPAFLGSTLLSVLLGLLAYPVSLHTVRRFRRSRSSAGKRPSAVS